MLLPQTCLSCHSSRDREFLLPLVDARVVTGGGTTSWHDLALYIISRHISPGEALRIAQVYLLKQHAEGQLPYRTLVRNAPHSDALVLRFQQALAENFREPAALTEAIRATGVPERTLKRRFKIAAGVTPIEYLQNLRIEEAKRLLENGTLAVEEIGHTVGYEEGSFFRRLFKRTVGLTPGQYRRLFRPLANSALATLHGEHTIQRPRAAAAGHEQQQ